MKFLLLAAFVGFCSATVLLPQLGGRKIYFEDDSNVLVHGLTGNQFIFRQRPGQRYVEILLNAVDTPMKKIYIDGETCKIINLEGFEQFYQKNYNIEKFYDQQQDVQQINYIFNVLKNYQGRVDDYQYQTLLRTLKEEVDNGKICYVVYHLLTLLDQFINEDFIQHYYVKNQLGDFYQTIYGKRFGELAPFGKRQQSDLLRQELYQKSYPYGYGYNYLVNPLYYSYQNQYQRQYPFNVQKYQQYQPNYYNQYPFLYNRGYFGGEKSFLKDYLIGKTYQNPVQDIYPMDKYYGQNVYGYGNVLDKFYGQNVYGYGNVMDKFYGQDVYGYGKVLDKLYGQNAYGYGNVMDKIYRPNVVGNIYGYGKNLLEQQYQQYPQQYYQY